MKKREDWGPADEFIGEVLPAVIVGTVIYIPFWLPLLWFVIEPLTRWLDAVGLPTLGTLIGLGAMLICMMLGVSLGGVIVHARNMKAEKKEEKKPEDGDPQ